MLIPVFDTDVQDLELSIARHLFPQCRTWDFDYGLLPLEHSEEGLFFRHFDVETTQTFAVFPRKHHSKFRILSYSLIDGCASVKMGFYPETLTCTIDTLKVFLMFEDTLNLECIQALSLARQGIPTRAYRWVQDNLNPDIHQDALTELKAYMQ